MSIARISEKASEAQSTGRVLPMRRFFQLLLAVGVTLGGAWLLSALYTPQGIRRFLHLFDPVWRLIRPLAFALLMVIARLANPFFLWLEAQISGLLRKPALGLAERTPVAPAAAQPGFFEKLPAWVPDLLVDVLVIVGLIVAGLALVGFLLLTWNASARAGCVTRRRKKARNASPPVAASWRGARALRNAAGMIRRFGLGSQLLAAISVQNIYANLGRLARGRGYPRPPAQPPDDYLPVLVQAFGGFEDRLGASPRPTCACTTAIIP